MCSFERTSCCQIVGFVNHQHYHNPKWTTSDDPDIKNVRSEVGRWIWAHNPEKYAYDNYGRVFNHLLSGAPFQNTNVPPGYSYKPWSIDQLFAMIDAGEPLKFDGDWS